MKSKMHVLMCVVLCGALVVGCGAQNDSQEAEAAVQAEEQVQQEETVQPVEATEATETETEAAEPAETAEATEAAAENGDAYIGEYLDQDNNDPNLEIAKGEDGKYTVQIGIYRLTTFDDGVGELTAEGMKFTATDGSGNPIGGIITLDGDKATVTFTDSTWELLENGSAFVYTKSSDTPNLWVNE